jgi:hypothetical protein
MSAANIPPIRAHRFHARFCCLSLRVACLCARVRVRCLTFDCGKHGECPDGGSRHAQHAQQHTAATRSRRGRHGGGRLNQPATATWSMVRWERSSSEPTACLLPSRQSAAPGHRFSRQSSLPFPCALLLCSCLSFLVSVPCPLCPPLLCSALLCSALLCSGPQQRARDRNRTEKLPPTNRKEKLPANCLGGCPTKRNTI